MSISVEKVKKKLAYNLDWRRKNRVKLRLRARVRYASDVEKSRKMRRASRKRHPERVMAYRDKHNKINKGWYLKNRVKLFKERVCDVCGKSIAGTKSRRWCTNCRVFGNRVVKRVYWNKVGKVKFKYGVEWNLQKYKAMARDGFKASCCGSQVDLVVHHIHEFGNRLDDHRLGNLVTLCRAHHASGHKRKVFYFGTV